MLQDLPHSPDPTSYDFYHLGCLKKSLDKYQLQSDNNIAANVINLLNVLHSDFLAKGFGVLVPTGKNVSVQAVTLTKVSYVSTCVRMC